MKNNSWIMMVLSVILVVIFNSTTAAQIKPEVNGNTIFKNILILGNSITRHQPAPDIGWFSDWGMAATSRDKDFVHLLEKKFKEVYNATGFHVGTIVPFERAYWKYDLSQLDSFKKLDPDLIILRIGENVNNESISKHNFGKYYEDLVNYFIDNNAKVKILCVSSFWKKEGVDSLIEKASYKRNCYFLKINELSDDPGNMALGKFENEGVARHPSDKGMMAIANSISQEVIRM